MTILADEIKRQPSIFNETVRGDEIRSDFLKTWSNISQGKNGVVALSGALIFFGLGSIGGVMDLRWYQNEWYGRHVYKNLKPSDFIFACDVFGDLLFERSNALYRLDGESGDIDLLLGSINSIGDLSLKDASGIFGGAPAKEAFAASVLGVDPLRLMPVTPFLIAGGTPHSHRLVRLAALLEKKAELAKRIQDLSDGETVDLTFWNQ